MFVVADEKPAVSFSTLEFRVQVIDELVNPTRFVPQVVWRAVGFDTLMSVEIVS